MNLLIVPFWLGQNGTVSDYTFPSSVFVVSQIFVVYSSATSLFSIFLFDFDTFWQVFIN